MIRKSNRSILNSLSIPYKTHHRIITYFAWSLLPTARQTHTASRHSNDNHDYSILLSSTAFTYVLILQPTLLSLLSTNTTTQYNIWYSFNRYTIHMKSLFMKSNKFINHSTTIHIHNLFRITSIHSSLHSTNSILTTSNRILNNHSSPLYTIFYFYFSLLICFLQYPSITIPSFPYPSSSTIYFPFPIYSSGYSFNSLPSQHSL